MYFDSEQCAFCVWRRGRLATGSKREGIGEIGLVVDEGSGEDSAHETDSATLSSIVCIDKRSERERERERF